MCGDRAPGRYDVVTRTGEYTWGTSHRPWPRSPAANLSSSRMNGCWLPASRPGGACPMVPAGTDVEGCGRSTDRPPTNSGFSDRPLRDTVADTWKWLQKEDPDWTPSSRAAVSGIDPEVEAVDRQHRLNAAAHAQRSATCRISPAMSSPGRGPHPRNSASATHSSPGG